MSNVTLREGGLYLLPNGQEFVLFAGSDETYLLYSPEDQGKDGLAHYWLSEEGRLYYREGRTNWGIRDLTDTGKTVQSLMKKTAAASG